jgi:putative solute:sodium symporter small subunit
MQVSEKHREYWRKTVRMTAIMLTVWFVVSFVVSYFARELNQFEFLGFPLGFYMGAQGALIIYVLIIWYYARYMNRLDIEYSVEQDDIRSS